MRAFNQLRALNQTRPTNSEAKSRLTRYLVSLLVMSFFLLAASAAFAVPPRYAHRKGVVVGLGVGGGIGAIKFDKETWDTDRQLGLTLHGLIGGGVNNNVVLGLGVNSWIRTVKLGSLESTHIQWDFLAQGDFFLFDGFYLEGGAGLAYADYEGQTGNNAPTNYGELGLALRAGLGYEYFLNGTHALGINAGYTRHFYQNTSFDTIGLGVGIRWY